MYGSESRSFRKEGMSMKEYYLAIDIGASSGRGIVGWMEQGTLLTREVYRFPNGMQKKNGHLCWDLDALKGHLIGALKACVEAGTLPSYMGIDTWGVDFVLLDENDEILGDAVGYRDSRNEGMDALAYEKMDEKELYARTGIQKAIFNTVYQLMAVKQENPEHLERARTFLMIPEYLNFFLTGVKAAEYTNASTTQLLDAARCDWDGELLARLGYPREIFLPISMPGTCLGTLRPEIAAEVGFDLKVILPATHDTGSAVLAVPSDEEDVAYISSGTWSLLGAERSEPDTSEQSRLLNFTNEGGYDRRFRYLKNIMGLWMIQSMKKELEARGEKYTFDQLCDMAVACGDTPLRVSVNDSCFLSPDSMIAAVEKACGKENMSVGELYAVVYHSLAECYRADVRGLEQILSREIKAIHIVGGGSKDDYLNRLTAEVSGKTVYAGPSEATAIGNILAQMLASGVFESVAQAREAVRASFPIKTYHA